MELMIRLKCLLLIAPLALPGCMKQGTTMPLPPVLQQNPPPKVMSDATLRIRTLARLSDTYTRLCNQLPGRSVSEHRQLMADGFADLNEILPMLQGPTTDAEFNQQMRMIADARAELASGSADLSAEPTIDTGLRALRDLLREIAGTAYFDRADLPPLLDRYSNKIDELDTVRGPLHQLVVGEAMGMSSQIVAKMSNELSQRMAEQNSTQPATWPASRPAAAA